MQWMAWTLPTAIFFGVIIAVLIAMTIWEIKSRPIERRGFLPMSTTRGDRLFIGLLTAAFIHMGFLAFSSVSLWWAFGIAIALMLLIGVWG